MSDEWGMGNDNSACSFVLASESAVSSSSVSMPESQLWEILFLVRPLPTLLSGALRLCPHDGNHSVTYPGGERVTELSSSLHTAISKFLQDWLVIFFPWHPEDTFSDFPSREWSFGLMSQQNWVLRAAFCIFVLLQLSGIFINGQTLWKRKTGRCCFKRRGRLKEVILPSLKICACGKKARTKSSWLLGWNGSIVGDVFYFSRFYKWSKL